MTLIVAVSGGRDVLVVASDSARVTRDLETGAARGKGPGQDDSKLHPLSARHPIAAGTFGLSGCSTSRVTTTESTAARCRRRFDGEDPARPEWALDSGYTVEAVARRFAEATHRTFSSLLTEILSRRWPDPEGLRAGALPGGAFVGGLVAGYSSGGGPPEAWFFLVTAAGVVDVVRKFRGGPGRWGVAITPGADAAAAAYRGIIREVPRTLDHAAAMARDLVQVEIAAPASPCNAAGPVQLLGLAPGAPPRVLEPAAC